MVLSDQFQKIFLSRGFRKTFILMSGLLAMTVPTLSQSLAPHQQCARYEHELRSVDNQILVGQRQSPRTVRLMQMLHQAKQDGDKFSCYPTRFRSTSTTEQCHYILSSQQRISAALGKTTHQTATGQQRKLRHMLYQQMLQAGCRKPHELNQLMNDNRPLKRAKQRQRINPNYKAQQPQRHAALPKMAQPAAIMPRKATNDAQKIYKSESVGYSIPAVPALQHTKTMEQEIKAAEQTPPPREPVVLDYVSDPNIRRVGPLFLPAQ